MLESTMSSPRPTPRAQPPRFVGTELAPGVPVAGPPTVQIGDARIARDRCGDPVADILVKSGEWMAEVAWVASPAAAEDAPKAGIAFTIEAKGSGGDRGRSGAARGARLTPIEGRSARRRRRRRPQVNSAGKRAPRLDRAW
jgi:hypothetical protein